jgi:hypothetical protein
VKGSERLAQARRQEARRGANTRRYAHVSRSRFTIRPYSGLLAPGTHTCGVENDPPICPACGVTMVPAELSAHEQSGSDWVCLECEETDEPD